MDEPILTRDEQKAILVTPALPWWSVQNTLVAVMLVVSAWCLGSVITTSTQNSALSKQVSTLQQSVQQHEDWIRQVQADQKKSAEQVAEALTRISTNVAEVKGAASVRRPK